MNGQQVLVGEKTLEPVAVADAGIARGAGIVRNGVEQIGFFLILAMVVRFEGHLDGGLPFLSGRDENILQARQVNIFDGSLEKVLQGIVERAFPAAVLAVDEEIFCRQR